MSDSPAAWLREHRAAPAVIDAILARNPAITVAELEAGLAAARSRAQLRDPLAYVLTAWSRGLRPTGAARPQSASGTESGPASHPGDAPA